MRREDPRVLPTAEVKRRLAARGIDADASVSRFLLEVRVQGPPPRLAAVLGLRAGR